MATYIKGEPHYEDDKTIMSRITIKNEPGISVIPSDNIIVKPEQKHYMIPSSCSLTEGPAVNMAKTEYPLINQTFIPVKEEITVKDDHIQDESFDTFARNSKDICSLSMENSQRYVSYLWNMDKDTDQINTIKSESEEYQDEIKTESAHAMADSESQLMITNVQTVLNGEDNVGEMKISVPAETIPTGSLQENEQGTMVNPAKDNNFTCDTNKPQTLNARINTGGKQYKCKACGKSFSNKNQLKIHYRVHTGEKPYKCSVCEKSFVQSSCLTRHKWIHTNEKPYKCSICEKCFVQSSALARHNLIHSGKRPYKCSICEKSFTQSSVLTTHNRTHTGEKPYKCKVCGHSFTDSGVLTKHNRIHTGEKPYKCSICEKCFVRSSDLARHNLIHSGKRPYKCSICEKSFAQSSYLTTHNRTHTGEKPYKCGVCEKSFIRKDQLTRHNQIHMDKRVKVQSLD